MVNPLKLDELFSLPDQVEYDLDRSLIPADGIIVVNVPHPTEPEKYWPVKIALTPTGVRVTLDDDENDELFGYYADLL